MPLDDLVSSLSLRHRVEEARIAINIAHSEQRLSKIALVSSFGAEAAVLLHLVATTQPDMPVLFLDTGKHFAETLSYQKELSRDLGLRDLRVIKPDGQNLAKEDPYGALHTFDTSACCGLRKVAPLKNALKEFDGWITGRKRYQGGIRKSLEVFEGDEATGKLKINPLAHWSLEDMRAYAQSHSLPPHPLLAEGYLSIGCAPCTNRTDDTDDPRAGRWAGQDKSECGIHVPSALNTTESTLS
ncbi:phosphoadenylyl-sulfate reductase [Planktotalea sp.]|uniref:phosphoadenylyl-sulfate reductase n=1 Tax=Planktotalea sp. TaxID=2029877 RepID=UPI0026013F90|nr:phosphoadenylyl-sulfate reductase [Planktotalea sp.]